MNSKRLDKWKQVVKENWERLVALCAWAESHPLLALLLKLAIKVLLQLLER